MHDDLIKRLREEAIRADSGNEISESLYHDILKAADAIEELSKELIELKLLTCCCGEPLKEET